MHEQDRRPGRLDVGDQEPALARAAGARGGRRRPAPPRPADQPERPGRTCAPSQTASTALPARTAGSSSARAAPTSPRAREATEAAALQGARGGCGADRGRDAMAGHCTTGPGDGCDDRPRPAPGLRPKRARSARLPVTTLSRAQRQDELDLHADVVQPLCVQGPDGLDPVHDERGLESADVLRRRRHLRRHQLTEVSTPAPRRPGVSGRSSAGPRAAAGRRAGARAVVDSGSDPGPPRGRRSSRPARRSWRSGRCRRSGRWWAAQRWRGPARSRPGRSSRPRPGRAGHVAVRRDHEHVLEPRHAPDACQPHLGCRAPRPRCRSTRGARPGRGRGARARRGVLPAPGGREGQGERGEGDPGGTAGPGPDRAGPQRQADGIRTSHPDGGSGAPSWAPSSSGDLRTAAGRRAGGDHSRVKISASRCIRGRTHAPLPR